MRTAVFSTCSTEICGRVVREDKKLLRLDIAKPFANTKSNVTFRVIMAGYLIVICLSRGSIASRMCCLHINEVRGNRNVPPVGMWRLGEGLSGPEIWRP